MWGYLLSLAGCICWLTTASLWADEKTDALLQQATQAAQRGEHDRAVAKLSEVIAADPKLAIAWYLRGRENYRAGKFGPSLGDFDRYIELEPSSANKQWERGITCYYGAEFAKGAKQFADYQKFHDQDVENSAWRYLCVARAEGIEKARSTLLPIKDDPRVPMMAIYGLYQGKLKPEDVLAAANNAPPNRELHNQRLFYAHLYLGLWYEAAKQPAEAKQHILEAEKHKIAHYMWDVARVHADLLRAKE